MGISSVWIDILEVSSTTDSIGESCEGCPSAGRDSCGFFAWSPATGGCTPLLEGSGGVGSLISRGLNCGPVSPARIFEVDVLAFLDAGRGKPSSSSSSSLGISRRMESLGPLSLEAAAPAWSLTIARVELMADLQ